MCGKHVLRLNSPFPRPYIIYMLEDMDIIEDWTLIKKAIKQKQPQQFRRPKGGSSSTSGECVWFVVGVRSVDVYVICGGL